MKTFLNLIFFLWIVNGAMAAQWPDRKETLSRLTLVNDRFMADWPNPGDSIYVKGVRPSNIWTRSVYMEGLMALNEVDAQPRYIDYAIDWAVAHLWGFRGGTHTRNADDQCCAQIYIDLYRIHGEDYVLGNTERMVNNVVNSTEREDWTWIDALQMAMPVYAKMGVEKKDIRYFRTMNELYLYTRNQAGRIGLFNPVEGLWWRDKDFLPPYKEPNGKNCYWSRGNGWVMAALARTIDEMDKVENDFTGDTKKELSDIKQLLVNDFLTMAMSVKGCQRKDGFWNCSLMDEHHYGGPETSGTALFIYSMAWGVRKDYLSPEVFGPVITKAWNAIMQQAVHPDGLLGYVQGTGKEPKDGQPVGYDIMPDFTDFGTGCFLLAGSEIIKLIDN